MTLTYSPLHSITLLSSQAVKAKRFVAIDGTHATSSAAAVGISEHDCDPGRALSALTAYSGLMEAGGAIPFGSPVKPATDGSGRAVVGSAADYCGRAMTEASGAGATLVVRFIEIGGSPAPAPSEAPVNTVLPAISGTTTVGQTLTVSDGSWSGGPTLTRQWKRNGVAIAGATGATYLLAAADIGASITVTVTGTNLAGSTSVTTVGTAAVAAAGGGAAPVNTVLPVITGTAQEGQQIAATVGTWSNAPTGYSSQWKRNGVAISGAITNSANPTYTLTSADVGQVITITTTATNASGSASATSAATAAVTAAPSGGDTRARYGVAAANPGAAAVFAALAVAPSSANNSVAGQITINPSSTQYGWYAVSQAAYQAAGGVQFFDGVGTGGWSGAGLAGDNQGASASPRSLSTLTHNDGTTTWVLLRQDVRQSPGTFTVS